MNCARWRIAVLCASLTPIHELFPKIGRCRLDESTPISSRTRPGPQLFLRHAMFAVRHHSWKMPPGFSLCLARAIKESEPSALGQREIDDDLGRQDVITGSIVFLGGNEQCCFR